MKKIVIIIVIVLIVALVGFAYYRDRTIIRDREIREGDQVAGMTVEKITEAGVQFSGKVTLWGDFSVVRHYDEKSDSYKDGLVRFRVANIDEAASIPWITKTENGWIADESFFQLSQSPEIVFYFSNSMTAYKLLGTKADKGVAKVVIDNYFREEQVRFRQDKATLIEVLEKHLAR